MKEKETYMKELRKWLEDTSDSPLEEMAEFFTRRLEGYEDHMAVWKESYRKFAGLLPADCRDILDLGCGTGLELDQIWREHGHVAVTGVDMCRSMLDKLREKHPDKPLTILCQDYFRYDFGCSRWDAVISFESLHHFLPERKEELYRKIHEGLKENGLFILGDYTACCDEEEELLRGVYRERRRRFRIPEERFVHFDIPLTVEHERELLQRAGFLVTQVLDEPDGVTFITARKTGR